MKIERDDSLGWMITEFNKKERLELIEDIKCSYRSELSEMESEEAFNAKAIETADSILNNNIEEAYIDMYGKEDVLVIVPEYGFGSVEYKISTILM
jgi:hypothetical protein